MGSRSVVNESEGIRGLKKSDLVFVYLDCSMMMTS